MGMVANPGFHSPSGPALCSLFFLLYSYICLQISYLHQQVVLSIRMVRKNLKELEQFLITLNKQINLPVTHFHSPLQPIKFGLNLIQSKFVMEHHESSHHAPDHRHLSYRKIKYVSHPSDYEPQDDQNLDRLVVQGRSKRRQPLKNVPAFDDFSHAQSKGRKINIKKLIELKEARENKERNAQVKLIPEYTKYFQRKQHPSITTCIVCGFIVFTSDEGRRKKQCLQHLQKLHSFLPNINENYPQVECNSDEEYDNMAGKLLKFANSEQNGEVMQFVIGQRQVQAFKPYVEHLKVEESIQRWTKSVERAFNFYDF